MRTCDPSDHSIGYTTYSGLSMNRLRELAYNLELLQLQIFSEFCATSHFWGEQMFVVDGVTVKNTSEW